MGYYNRLGASTAYTASTASYDVGSGATRLRGFKTFVEYTPNDQDMMNVFVKKDTDNWLIAKVYYDDATTSLITDTVITSRGTISDEDAVDVAVAVIAEDFYYYDSIIEKTTDFTVDGTTYMAALFGDLVHYNSITFAVNSSSAVVVTLDDSQDAGAVFDVIRVGTGTVTFTPASGNTINGGSGSVSISAQWKSARVYNNMTASTDWCVTFSA